MTNEMMMGLICCKMNSLWMSFVATRQKLITQPVHLRLKRLALVLVEHALDDDIAMHFHVVALRWRQWWPGPVELWSIVQC